MALSVAEVARLGDLAQIALTQAELELLAPQLELILESVAVVASAVGPDIPPTSHAMPLSNVFRPDAVEVSVVGEQVLAAAPAVEDGRFRVPRILGEEA